MKRDKSDEETRQNWKGYYSTREEAPDLFKKDFEKYTYTHTWHNSIRTIIENTRPRAGEKILEAGSGWGRMVLGLVERLNQSQITAMDLSRHALSIGESLIGVENNGNTIEWIEGNVEEIPLPDNMFDVVYSARVFQHLNRPEKGVAEILRVLKPGGRFLIFLQNKLCPLNFSYYSRLYTPGQVKRWFDGSRASEPRIRTMDFYPGFLSNVPLETRMRLERFMERIPGLNLFGGKVLAMGRKQPRGDLQGGGRR
ncbi:MAG: class I SAM-dependent methyltransferase [Desulfobacterales bacterium]|nr:class I SAM-dependent methyltransferase [Desulfobacterales bacterium]